MIVDSTPAEGRMKIILTETKPTVDTTLEGDYACMYKTFRDWHLQTVRQQSGESCSSSILSTGGHSNRENIRRCIKDAVDNDVENLILWTDEFPEVHGVIERFSDHPFELEIAKAPPTFPIPLFHR